MELAVWESLTANIERCLGNIDAGGNSAQRGSSAKPLTRAAPRAAAAAAAYPGPHATSSVRTPDAT